MSNEHDSDATNELVLKELQEVNRRLAGFRRRPWKVHMTMQVFVAVVAAHLFTLAMLAFGLPLLGIALLGAGAAGSAYQEQQAGERYRQSIEDAEAIEPAEPKSLQDWADEQSSRNP
jgi:flagellar biosynthesis component FlhA